MSSQILVVLLRKGPTMHTTTHNHSFPFDFLEKYLTLAHAASQYREPLLPQK